MERLYRAALAVSRHGAVTGETLHFDYFHLGCAEGDDLFAEGAGYEHLLVMVEDISGFGWPEPA